MRNLESLGYLAGGLAHDFNNILTAQMGHIEMATFYLDDKVKAESHLDSALMATGTAKELAARLLTFAEGGHPVSRPVILDRLIEETLQLALGGTNITCDFQTSGSLEPVTVDENQIRSAFRNIIQNAKEAMPQGGSLRVTTREVDVLSGNKDRMTPGKYIRIEISDHGTGISADDLEKVFDPYFTTKPMGAQKGTGLGLTICHSIIKKHHGHIAVRCPKGEGTVVTVHLPLKLQSTDASPSEGISGLENRMPRPKFLIMDDEKVICDIVREVLERINCEIDFASNGEEAIDLYKRSLKNGSYYAGLFLDMTIPHGIGGVEAVKKILEINPEAKAVVLSGNTADPVIADFRKFGFAAALKKPFKLDELKTVVFQLLSHLGNHIQPEK